MVAKTGGRRRATWISIATLTMMVVSGLSMGAGGAAASPVANSLTDHSSVTSSSLGTYSPTFVGPAATGCNNPGCSLLTGPFGPFSPLAVTPSAAGAALATPLAHSGMPSINPRGAVAQSHEALNAKPALSVPPVVSCDPMRAGCDFINQTSGGAVGVKGLNAFETANLYGGEIVEPADQGLCAGNGYVIETNNLGEILIFNPALGLLSAPISLDTLMGLTTLGWSSGGDVSCLYDYNHGGHWFFTEFVSPTSEASGGIFAGCFAGVANTCYEGIAVSVGSNPFGHYNLYLLNANYNPAEPGYPYELNDFAKIATTQDAFLVFYDEFPLYCGGFGLGCFNGAQEFAFDKKAMELGLPTTLHSGMPNPKFNVAIENMGLFPTPDGTCPGTHGATCWYQVIPAQSPDPTQFDNSHGGSGFMLAALDFFGAGDNRIAIFDWTGLSHLDSLKCGSCSGIMFGGQLFSGVESYYNLGFVAPQKAGRIPLGDACVANGLNTTNVSVVSCPEGGIATNGDGFTQVSLAGGQVWGAISTAILQSYNSGVGCPCLEPHMGAAYWVIGTDPFDSTGWFTLTNQQYVTAMHEDLEFPAIAAEGSWSQDGGNLGAIITFTLSGNGGPTGANHGGFYPSTAYGRLTSTSNGLVGRAVYIADKGKAPQDGFTEYQGYPNGTRPRWGDYSWAIFMPNSGGKVYFATNYIQSPNCSDARFAIDPTCGGTRNAFANWGTSVNFAVP